MSVSTQFSNATQHVMKVKVGSARCASHLATVEVGGKFVVGVDYNSTYREYIVGIDAAGMENVVVSSDDLCDNKCITINEEDGKLNVQMEPRDSNTATLDAPNDTSAKRAKWLPAWLSKFELANRS